MSLIIIAELVCFTMNNLNGKLRFRKYEAYLYILVTPFYNTMKTREKQTHQQR